MEKEAASIIDADGIPVELKFALSDYSQALKELKPALPPPFQARYTFWLEQLLKEACDAQVNFHWWETMLELIPQQVEQLGASSRTLQEAGSRLRPLMSGHLGPYEGVSLREIGEDIVLRVCFLSDTLVEPQKYMVAPNAISLAQALVNPKAWYRAIFAGKMLVGFIMLYDDDQEADYFLWRFMISRPCQGRGYGTQAIQRLVEYVKTRPNARELGVSCGVGPGSPQGFYEKVGFVSTGEFDDGELVLKRKIKID